MPGPLFTNQPLDQYCQQRMSRMEEAILQVTDVEELAALATGEGYRIEPLSLRREEAEFAFNDNPKGIEVVVTIPYSGNSGLFWCKPEGMQGRPPSGDVHSSGRWDAGQKKPDALILKQQFPHGVDRDAVRSWAKEQVDTIERILEAQRQRVDYHNNYVPDAAADMVKKRRDALTGAESLRRDIGRGI